MRFRRKLAIGALVVGAAGTLLVAYKSRLNYSRAPGVPLTWDEEALAQAAIPLASTRHSPKFVSSRFYYWIPIRPLLKTYPVYHPDREPQGYVDWLRQQPPVEAWDGGTPTSKKEWARFGKLVFEAPLFGGAIAAGPGEYWNQLYVRDPNWHDTVRAPIADDGTLPFYRYVIQEQGQVRVGVLSCAMCHTRVLEDGTAVAGAQGNLPFDRAFAFDCLNGGNEPAQQAALERLLYHVPWIKGVAEVPAPSKKEIADRHFAIPAGVMARHGSTPEFPVAIPDLFDLADRHYFDRTGLQRNRGIGDIMRYAALNQGGDDFSYYGDFSPIQGFVGSYIPPFVVPAGRYSDDQLFALATYIESLKPPENPHPLSELTLRGKQLFDDEGCARCHTPPLYTSNKLTPADGFDIPARHRDSYAIEPESLGTDAGLATKTRRGTGYYKIPSLRNVWLRGPLGHDGSCATLEDWFDPNRLRDDYTPTGFIGHGVRRRAVPGHEYGLGLEEEDRRALIAFLRTL